MKDPTKFHFELTQDESGDIYASLAMAAKAMLEQDGATPQQIFKGMSLLKFAEEWHQMFHSQFVANAPATETKN